MNKQLDDLSRNLTEMIKDVNQISSSSQPHARPASPSGGEINQAEDDPVTQLSAILGSHLRALNGIDGRSGKLETDLRELERRLAGGGSGNERGMSGSGTNGSYGRGGAGGGYGLSRLG